MKLTQEIKEVILNAESKALATMNLSLINVVPVSTMKIINKKIILVDYFMGKTVENIKANSHVALTCWTGFTGYQIKADAEYKTRGDVFDRIKTWVAEILPDRMVKGILLLEPNAVFNISPNAIVPGEQIL